MKGCEGLICKIFVIFTSYIEVQYSYNVVLENGTSLAGKQGTPPS